MFERLAGKLLSRLLSKYFRSSDEATSNAASNKSGSPTSSASTTTASAPATTSSSSVNTQLSVWSGYVTLENLELRRELLNDWFARQGLGLELVQCTVRRIELTVPWSKLSSSLKKGQQQQTSLDDPDAAVVVVVLDGVHILLRTNLQFDDAALRDESIRKRRQALSEVVDDLKGKSSESCSCSSSSSFVSFLKRRFSQWTGFAKKIQVHVRDVHIRWEDVESDPSNPFACGITLESMHIQQDSNDENEETAVAGAARADGTDVIRKVAQLNHLAVYWNALDYHDVEGVPTEFSILHQSLSSPSSLARVLDRSIARRSTLSSTLFQAPSLFPKHTYLLLPVDATMRGAFSSATSSNQDSLTTALLPTCSGILEIDLVSVQLRDYQYAGILTCLAAFREHAHMKRYRKYYRPTVSVMENPRAWWYYAWQAIRYELKSHLRWSWKRFYHRFAQRQRYCDLHERYLRSTTATNANNTPISNSTRPSRQNSRASEMDRMAEIMPNLAISTALKTTPDDGAGPSNSFMEHSTYSFAIRETTETPLASAATILTVEERQELQDMEDGLRGELSLDDIIMYRALVKSRLHLRQNQNDSTTMTTTRSSFWRWAIQNEVLDDKEIEEELNRLMAYVEQGGANDQQDVKDKNPLHRNQAVLSLDLRLGQGCVALFSPLKSTADLEPRRRLQERFFELSTISLQMHYVLMGDYSTFQFHAALANLLASEIRSNRKHYTVVARSSSQSLSLIEIEDALKGAESLLDVEIATNPQERETSCDLLIRGQAELLHIFLAPDCEWIKRIVQLAKCVPSVSRVETFWEDISMAMVNSWGRGLVHLRKKASAVIFNHKRVELSVSIRCPVLHVGAGNEEESLVIDLGTAHLSTEKLGGSAVTKTSNNTAAAPSATRSKKRIDGSDDQTTTSPTASPRRKLYRMSSVGSPMPDRFDVGSTAMSVVDGFTPFMSSRSILGNTNYGESVQLGVDEFPDVDFENPVDVQERRDLQSCFYDTYQLRVRTGTMTIFWDDHNLEEDCLLDSIDMRILMKKSVIPADHTLCRLKCNCLVDSLCVVVSPSDILRFFRLFKVWRDVFGKHENQTFFPVPQQPVPSQRTKQRLLPIPPTTSMDDGTSDASSELEENEFFDTVESEEDTGAWFEESWIVDSETVLEAGGKGLVRARRRPRLPSMSDVSSSSDQSSSQKQQGGRGVTYLSAENLAKLEERVVEEDSISKDSNQSVAETFHSVLSLNRQAELASDLERSIIEVEANISMLNDKLSEATKMQANSSSEAKQRRLFRKHVLLELERSSAEVRALRSAQEKLKKDMIASQEYLQGHKGGLGVGDFAGGEMQPPSAILESVGLARALVLDRSRRRGAVDSDGFRHSLTRNLNREIFMGSMTVGSVAVELRGIEKESGGKSFDTLLVAIAQSTVGIVKRAKDAKVYGSVDHFSVKSTTNEAKQAPHYLVLGGGYFPLAQLLLPSQYPQHLPSTTIDERFCRLSIEVCRSRQNTKWRSARVRVVVGDVELQPDASLVRNLVKTFHSVGREIIATLNEASPATKSKRNVAKRLDRGFIPFALFDQSLVDAYVRLTSFRVRLINDERTIGAIVLTDVALRLAQDASDTVYRGRGHTELRLGNMQLLDVDASESFTCRELLGRKESYDALVRVWIRWQLVPLSEQGGWTVDRAFIKGDSDYKDDQPAVWNVHCGSKVQSVGIVASSKAASRQIVALISLKKAFKGSHHVEVRQDVFDSHDDDANQTLTRPVRWRWDILVGKLSIDFPNTVQPESFTAHETNAFSFFLSLSACLQVAQSTPSRLSLRVAATGLTILRTHDEWPLVDNVMAMVEVQAALGRKSGLREELTSLRLPSDSPWNVISAVMHRYRWDEMSARHDTAAPLSVAIALSTFSLNLTPQACAQLHDAAVLFVKPFGSNELRRSESYREDHNGSTLRFAVTTSLESFELKIGREQDRKPAKIVVLAEANDVFFSARKLGDDMDLSIRLGDAAVFDTSFSPGVRIVGRQNGQESQQIEIPRMLSTSKEHCADFLLVRVGLNSSSTCSKSATLEVNFGHIHCLLVPSFFHSLVFFARQLAQQMRKDTSAAVSSGNASLAQQQLALPLGSDRILVALRTSSFECFISSRDIQSCINEKGAEPISVVTVRWSSEVKAELSVKQGQEDFDLTSLDGTNSKNWLETVQAEHVAATLRAPGEQFTSRVASFKLDLDLSQFLVARTTISKQKGKERKIGYSDSSPYHFLSTVPATGEQRITNSMNCKITYRAICTSRQSIQGMGSISGKDKCELALSQVLRIEARLVDVLVYVNQSPGGINDAIRVTISPILSLLKGGENKGSKTGPVHSSSVMDEMMRNATTVWSMHAEGFQITCVPGGATRLTESPIIKCALSKFEAGGGALAAPRELKWLLGSGKLSAVRHQGNLELQPPLKNMHEGSTLDPLLTRLTVLHLVTGAWLNAELSASYHNRRLVAWEPFVEPWILSVRLGGDLTQLLSLQPLESIDSSSWDAATSERSLPAAVPTTLNDTASERMRDLGRLLRSPFKLDAASRKNSKQDEPLSVVSEADFCYHLLASASRNDVARAVYCPPILAKRRPCQADVAVPPGHHPQEWLQRFGYPEAAGAYPSLVCSMTDSMAFNVNLTGALLENLLAYLRGGNNSGQRPSAPHRVRNDTGMTIRFQEVLDPARRSRGEKSSKRILSNGSEIPLSLKRSLSQSCDPHRGYIYLELGSFEDTAGRLNHDEYERPQGSLSTAFYFKVVAKIPVDTVGVHKYPLCRNFNRRAAFIDKERDSRGTLGYVIVRVALQGGVKLVSIESPFVIKNDTDVDIICELRSHEGLSLLWRRWIPKPTRPIHDSALRTGMVSIPVDLVSSIHDETYSLSIAALPRTCSISDQTVCDNFVQHQSVRLAAPPPYSKFSVNRGVIKVEHVSLNPAEVDIDNCEHVASTLIRLNVCSVRIGSVSSALASLKSSAKEGVIPKVEIPEQRMVLVQSPLVVRSHLPALIQVQLKLKTGKRASLEADKKNDFLTDWETLGKVECGEAVSWTGASPQDKVEIRCRLLEDDGQPSELFPTWSSVAVIPSARDLRTIPSRPANSKPDTVVTLKLCDRFGQIVSISLTVEGGHYLGNNDVDDIKLFAKSLPLSPRVISMYVPFWVVDSTNQDLEFFAGAVVAGQLCNRSWGAPNKNSNQDGFCSGLAEIFANDSLCFIARPQFDVLMIGDEKASRLTMRRRMLRGIRKGELVSPWSNPVFLRTNGNTFQDVLVPPPAQFVNGQNEVFEPYALRSRIFPAPERFGGAFGTKILHIVNRFEIVNEMGRDIEVLADRGNGVSVTFKSERLLRPFHFDDSGPIRFRPKELGWYWSGRFEVSRKRKELTLRLRHKLRSETIIACIEFYTPKNPPVTYIVFRNASHPPFRIENHTMHPLSVSQIPAFWSLETGKLWSNDLASTGVVLLPYQNLDLAWDQPDGKNSVMIEVANIELSPDDQSQYDRQILGCYDLERIAPGTKLPVHQEGFSGHVLADGPTRIVRLTDSALPVFSIPRRDVVKKPETSSSKILYFELKLVHGIGVSVVDWTPQELLYVRLDDILVERRIDEELEHVTFSISSVTIDNQLWLTPFPVLMLTKMDHLRLPTNERRKQNRSSAVAIYWSRRLNTYGAHGNLTLIERVEVVTEPFVFNVDVQLVDLIAAMIHRVSDAGTNNQTANTLPSRNADLRKVLGISYLSKEKNVSRPSMPHHDSSADFFVVLGCSPDSLTAVFATKQKLQRQSVAVGTESASKNSSAAKVEWVDSLLRPRQKLYVERLRIATAKSEINWSGPLPSALMSFPRFMTPVFTFEGLPLLIRPYSSSHKYGTLEDHLEELKSHYLSIWRIVDLLLGVVFNPTFMIRACVYTFRETVAVTFDSLSKALSNASPTSNNPYGMVLISSRLPEFTFRWIFFESLSSLSSSILLGSSKAAATFASLFRYGGKANMAVSRVVRSRNPRLFATADGNDLLVEYVEGENAGRALLSRVRMGAHSAEGYLFHSECTIHQQPQRLDSLELICMVTSERILLLNGIRDVMFCSVTWETKFENLVHLEVLISDNELMFDHVKLWYLIDSDHTVGNSSDIIGRYAQAVVGALDLGLDVLVCKDLFVPRTNGLALRDKINSIQSKFFDKSGVTFSTATSK